MCRRNEIEIRITGRRRLWRPRCLSSCHVILLCNVQCIILSVEAKTNIGQAEQSCAAEHRHLRRASSGSGSYLVGLDVRS